ncbi:hypothetical protein MUN88_06920 [Gracilibacillus caseinilyticus]|uniref:Beta/Gamma crystallin n=1 Tax=Gracilibacillus caseinilyticus TaxID=2932256 RepID=A0ABY4EZU9_9BACI|nr:hypothetical protein [Gracilibacillus caseinilyticus]UOQ49800.1 hypothetical protein MUN88_06920 [Gracilibacillus caseinilyticus]
MFKKVCSLLIIPIIIILVSSAFPSETKAASNYQWFATGDGYWDGTFKARSGQDVTVFINDWGQWGHYNDWLKVRLCRVGGGCTIYKLVVYDDKNWTTFTNMAAGTYHGDVAKVHNPSNQIKGKISFRVEW